MISEILDYARDALVILAGSGIFTKVAIDWNISRKEKAIQSNNSNSNGNGKTHYATMSELMKHAVECPKGIHEKIEEYNSKLKDHMDFNHKETMNTFTDIKVAIAKLETKMDT